MPERKPQVDDAFWHGEVGFVCDDSFTDAQLPDAASVGQEDFHEILAHSSRLPDLNGAPVASWDLARLARLSAKRFPYEFAQVLGSDRADFWLRFLSFNSRFKPLGVVTLIANETAVRLWAQISPATESEQVIAAFTQSLLSHPTELKRTRLIVAYTDFSELNHCKKLPFVFGWDGNKFLCDHSAEDAISADDIE